MSISISEVIVKAGKWKMYGRFENLNIISEIHIITHI